MRRQGVDGRGPTGLIKLRKSCYFLRSGIVIGRLLLPATALALLMTLAACGGPDAPTSPTTSDNAAVPTADETPLGPAPGSVDMDREILIAVYNALDGPNWESPNPG